MRRIDALYQPRIQRRLCMYILQTISYIVFVEYNNEMKIKLVLEVFCEVKFWREEREATFRRGNLCQLPTLLLLPGHPVRKNSACLGDMFSKVQCHGITVFFLEETGVFCYEREWGSSWGGSVSLLMLNWTIFSFFLKNPARVRAFVRSFPWILFGCEEVKWFPIDTGCSVEGFQYKSCYFRTICLMDTGVKAIIKVKRGLLKVGKVSFIWFRWSRLRALKPKRARALTRSFFS